MSLAKERKKKQLHLLLKSIDFPFKWRWIEGLCVSATHLCMPSIIHHFHQREHLSFYLFTGPYVEHRPHLAPLSDFLNSPLCWQQTHQGCSVFGTQPVVLSYCQHLHSNSVFLHICLIRTQNHPLSHFKWCIEKYVTVNVKIIQLPSCIATMEIMQPVRWLMPIADMFDQYMWYLTVNIPNQLYIHWLHLYYENVLQSHYDQHSWTMTDYTKLMI